MFKTKKFWYISLFSILYLIVAFSSFWHAVSFFSLANNSWMSIILALAFEIGQAAVLFSLLTSKKDRSRIMPWVLMTMFTLVQVIGNVYSSYKYIITNSSENLRYFKEPIFIWTDLPDDQATVIIVYLVGALLPIASLLLTSMITNYLTDQEEENNKPILIPEEITKGPNPPIEIKDEKDFLKVYGDKDEKNLQDQKEINNDKEDERQTNNDNGEQQMESISGEETTRSSNGENDKDNRDIEEKETKDDEDESRDIRKDTKQPTTISQTQIYDPIEAKKKKDEEKNIPSHFVNLK